MGALLGITFMVYIKEKKGWGWGFGVPTSAMILSIFILAAGILYYRFQKPVGSPFSLQKDLPVALQKVIVIPVIRNVRWH